MSRELIAVPRATLDFYKYEEDGLTFYEYNATKCQPPEPMVNTMVGLSLLNDKNDRLVGIFFHEPFPLYSKIPLTISHEAVELESGDFRITFKID
ncbi:hypothetical protein [Sulfurimonas sp.]|uniref:hypothetical protein n=1 Tax=Sulfurimonas sp. TaxID=2022749 RepID=UPI0025FEBDD1|nr:hypothetical protein [Sulfurimonas sp.]MDD5156925.1 hypothetical protein [Sulfurimonas sp.]